MSDLIKRINSSVFVLLNKQEQDNLNTLLRDCRAEIELLTQSNQCLRDQNTALDEKLAEYSERTYTPMTDDEMHTVFDIWESTESKSAFSLAQQVEAAVVKRFLNPGDNNDS